MNITQFAIKNNKVTLVISILIFFYGIFSFLELPRAKDPGFIIRTATVVTYFPGASAKRVEQLVTDKLEKYIQEMPELDYVKSTSKKGVSILFVNILEKHKNVRPIWDKLRRKVQKAQRELPKEAYAPIVNDEFGDVFGTLVSISSNDIEYNTLEDKAKDIKDILLRLENVAKVEILGVQQEQIFIEFNNANLAKLNISSMYLKQILSKKNIVISGGEIKLESQRLSIEPTGNYEKIEELKNTLIPLPSGDKVYLKDIANVKLSYKNPPSSLLRVNLEKSLLLAISMKEDGDILRLGEQVDKKVEQIKNSMPYGIDLNIVFHESNIVKDITSSFTSNLLQAMGLVVIVMLFSLGFRSGLIVAVLIPMSVLLSFILMRAFDIWIDQVSLASLIISLGLLVDSAIVMSESIMVLIQKGKSKYDACIQSAKELKIPLLTSALTTSVAFLPIFLAKSNTGEYTNAIFKVVSITLLSSWILALTLTPVLSIYFMKKSKKEYSLDGIVYKTYKKILTFMLTNKTISLFSVLAIFIFSLSLIKYIPKAFFPPANEATFIFEVRLPVGTAIETTSKTVKQMEEFLKQNHNEDVKYITSFIGEGAPRFWLSYIKELASAEYAVMLVKTKQISSNLKVLKSLEEFAFKTFPNMQISAKPLQNGPPIKKPIEIRVSGKDTKTLFEISDKIKQELALVSGIKNISDNWGLKNKKIKIEINEAKALNAGITNEDIAISLQTALSGFEITQYRKDDKLIPIVLRSKQNIRDSINKLESINVYSQKSGVNIPLMQVAKVKVVFEESQIKRRDRLKTITISSEITDNANALEIFEKIKPWLDEYFKNFDLGYFYEFGGEKEVTGKSQDSIMVNLPLTAMVILLLMVAQFNSIRKPLIIISTIPLGIMGVIFGLLITNSYFGFMTLLGVISLSGIVINNAIVLLERIKIEKENGYNDFDAIIQASLSRFRPILLTTLTTILGLLPLWLNGGAMWEPMAISIIFGLIFATILTLGFIPTLYATLFKIRR